jgi:hypothetical protein
MARQLKSMGALPAFDYTGFISMAKLGATRWSTPKYLVHLAVEVDGAPVSI